MHRLILLVAEIYDYFWSRKTLLFFLHEWKSLFFLHYYVRICNWGNTEAKRATLSTGISLHRKTSLVGERQHPRLQTLAWTFRIFLPCVSCLINCLQKHQSKSRTRTRTRYATLTDRQLYLCSRLSRWDSWLVIPAYIYTMLKIIHARFGPMYLEIEDGVATANGIFINRARVINRTGSWKKQSKLLLTII